jgi:hypothetical protein
LGDAFVEVLERNKRLFLEKWDIGRHLQSVDPQASESAGGSRDPWNMLAVERYGDAYELFEAAVRADPANTRALFGLGLAAEGRGVPAAARVAYRTVLAMVPGDPEASQALARVAGGMNGRQDDPSVALCTVTSSGRANTPSEMVTGSRQPHSAERGPEMSWGTVRAPQ